MTEYEKPTHFGVPDRMVVEKGPSKLDSVSKPHPLSQNDTPHLFEDDFNLRRVRADFGLHMALKLAMERRLATTGSLDLPTAGGYRLHTGCIAPSHALVSSLTGSDVELGFADVLNTTEFAEKSRDPHNFGRVEKPGAKLEPAVL